MVNKNSIAKTVKQTTCLIHANASAGTELVGAHGDALGTVMDFVLDTGTGAVVYVLVASGGFMGIGEERYALPWAFVRPQPGAGGVQWHCATARLPPQYRLDNTAALPPSSAGCAGTIAE